MPAAVASSSMKLSCAKELGKADTPRNHEARKMGGMSFTVTRKFNDMEFKINYKGKVSADSIQLKFSMMDNEVSMTMKRATS